MKKIPSSDPLNYFPKSDMWLLFIDGHRLNEGPYAFDRNNSFSGLAGESGYVESMTRAWSAAMDSLDQNLNPDLIKWIHRLAISNIQQLEGLDNFRDGSCSFGLSLYTSNENFNEATLSADGLKELIMELNRFNTHRLNSKVFPANCITYVYQNEDITADKTYYIHFNEKHLHSERELCLMGRLLPENAEHILFPDFMRLIAENNPRNGNFTLLANSAKREEISAWIQSDIAVYYKELSIAKELENDDLIIRAIVQFTRRCLQGHYFYDGNGRTFANIFMNYLLIQNGLTPAILMTPNHLSGFSLQECVLEVKKGREIFKDFSTQSLCNVVTESKNKEILNSSALFKDRLKFALSSHPIARLAQLNDVYQKIVSGDLIPGNKPTLRWTKNKAQLKALEIICEVYHEEFNRLKHDILPNEDDKRYPIRSIEALNDLISRHVIAAKLGLAEEIVHSNLQQTNVSKK